MDRVSVCVAVVFNHRFDENVTKLKRIYQNRFSKVVFLMPFYNGDDKDIISVYESSYQFQGYFIQAYEKLVATGCNSFLFIADDMILNPLCNESNIISMFHLEDKLIGVSEIEMLNEANRFAWSHARYSSRPYYSKATSWKENLPSYYEALEKFRYFFNKPYPEEYEEAFFGTADVEMPKEMAEAKEAFLKQNKGVGIPYPMAGGYSDILFVKKEIMHPLFHTMGIFSAMNLFVEIAIPTSIVLTTPKDKVSIFYKFVDRTCRVMWTDSEKTEFCLKHKMQYKSLAENWDSSCLFVHPVKLSGWEV